MNIVSTLDIIFSSVGNFPQLFCLLPKSQNLDVEFAQIISITNRCKTVKQKSSGISDKFKYYFQLLRFEMYYLEAQCLLNRFSQPFKDILLRQISSEVVLLYFTRKPRYYNDFPELTKYYFVVVNNWFMLFFEKKNRILLSRKSILICKIHNFRYIYSHHL